MLVLVVVLGAGAVSWLSAHLRRAAASGAGTAAGVVSWQSAPVLVSADCARCGGAVSWLRRLRTFLFQPVACQQVVGFCLAIWVYAGVFLKFFFVLGHLSADQPTHQKQNIQKIRRGSGERLDRDIGLIFCVVFPLFLMNCFTIANAFIPLPSQSAHFYKLHHST